MSETVKLIIEISEERYNSTMRKAKYIRVTGIDAVLAKGIPLDDVKAEIEDQKKWLSEAGYNAYNVDIAFSSIRNCIGRQRR